MQTDVVQGIILEEKNGSVWNLKKISDETQIKQLLVVFRTQIL